MKLYLSFLCVVLAIAVLPIPSSYGEQPGVGATITIGDVDVAGVKLGMSVDQALSALQAFDPHFKISKRYRNNPKGGFNGSVPPRCRSVILPSAAAEEDERWTRRNFKHLAYNWAP